MHSYMPSNFLRSSWLWYVSLNTFSPSDLSMYVCSVVSFSWRNGFTDLYCA